MTLHTKYKVHFTVKDLEYLKGAIEVYCEIQYPRKVEDEQELYFLSDLHTLYFKVVNPKLNSLYAVGRKEVKFEIPLTHVLTLHHLLRHLQYSPPYQNILRQIDGIRVNVIPVVVEKNEVLL